MTKKYWDGKGVVGGIAVGLAALAMGTAAEAQVQKPKQSLGGTLTLKDHGTFYVHGKKVKTSFNGAPAAGAALPAEATIMIEQM